MTELPANTLLCVGGGGHGYHYPQIDSSNVLVVNIALQSDYGHIWFARDHYSLRMLYYPQTGQFRRWWGFEYRGGA